MSYLRKKHTGGEGGWLRTWNFLIKCGNSRGQEKEFTRVIISRNDMEFPQVLDIGLGICKVCNTSFGNSWGEASFCLEFLGVK